MDSGLSTYGMFVTKKDGRAAEMKCGMGALGFVSFTIE